MIPNTRFFSALAVLILVAPSARAEDPAATAQLGTSDGVLARQGDAVVTQAEIDAAFSKIPTIHRLPFIRNGERVDMLIRSIIHNKLLVEAAREVGFDQSPLIKARLVLAEEKELSEAWIMKVLEDAPEVDFEVLAHEAWLANQDAWRTPEKVDVSHILVSSESRPAEDAEALAHELRNRLDDDPSLWDSLVAEYSEDPSKDSNRGRFESVKRGDMVEPFEDAAFSLEAEGEISQPVETSYGFHLIRLNRKIPSELRPFEEVKDQAIAQAREKYLEGYHSRYMRQLLADPLEVSEEGVEEMVKRYFGDDLELAPDYME